MNAVDTNVLVYSLDRHEPAKQARALELLDRLGQSSERSVLLWQVAAELLSCLRRWQASGRVSSADSVAYFRSVRELFPLVLPTADVFDRSIDLSARYSMSHWDSMLPAACTIAGVSVLYSEDLDAGTRYDTVNVVNPFGSM